MRCALCAEAIETSVVRATNADIVYQRNGRREKEGQECRRRTAEQRKKEGNGSRRACEENQGGRDGRKKKRGRERGRKQK